MSDLGGHAVTEISQIKKGDRISIAVTDDEVIERSLRIASGRKSDNGRSKERREIHRRYFWGA